MTRRPPISPLFPYPPLSRSFDRMPGPVHRGPGFAHVVRPAADAVHIEPDRRPAAEMQLDMQDRKSTRLNSSHANISYAVFCLKKKKNNSANQHIYTMK